MKRCAENSPRKPEFALCFPDGKRNPENGFAQRMVAGACCCRFLRNEAGWRHARQGVDFQPPEYAAAVQDEVAAGIYLEPERLMGGHGNFLYPGGFCGGKVRRADFLRKTRLIFFGITVKPALGQDFHRRKPFDAALSVRRRFVFQNAAGELPAFDFFFGQAGGSGDDDVVDADYKEV